MDKKEDIEFEMYFSDNTLLETDGEFEQVKELMEEELGPHQWVIKTDVTIISPFGEGKMLLDLYYDKRVYIVIYGSPTTGYNPDINCLREWSLSRGWLAPEPIESVIRKDIPFWKQLWKTALIESSFFEKQYGKRPEMTFEDTEDQDEEDDMS
jgi:hypothetical protein